jgi:hypothetical protein
MHIFFEAIPRLIIIVGKCMATLEFIKRKTQLLASYNEGNPSVNKFDVVSHA